MISNLRVRELTVLADTLLLDTLSIAAGSVSFSDTAGNRLPDSLFTVDHARALVIARGYRGKISVGYRVFPVNFSVPYYHKSATACVVKPGQDSSRMYQITSDEALGDDEGRLQTNGSISRGITVGNSQDIIVNSDLNLQVNGTISDNLKLEGSISDSNIPIQADGNSQQIQDFDKVYLKAYNDNAEVTFGDYEVKQRDGSLLKYSKKAQGAETTVKNNVGHTELTNQAAVAVSKGKYSRNTFDGVEGNQGPYTLTGNDNETYIVVLSGTEKVFVDGQLKKRGEDNDYTIDYNSAEVTFTPYLPITKNSRIAVEFEYSDKNYARYLVVSNNELVSKRSRTWVNIYSEQDNKNQPVQQDLSDEQEQILADAGDETAYYQSGTIDTSQDEDVIHYVKIDTTVDGTTFSPVYRYTTLVTDVYTVSFSYLGKNKGNYDLATSSANGKVYQWVAPTASGTLQGDYEPVIAIIAPKKKHVVTVGNEYQVGRYTKTTFEAAVSSNDANTFSSIGDDDNTGIGLRAGVEQKIPLGSEKNYLLAYAKQHVFDWRFDPVDQYKSVEFERDWNLTSTTTTDNEYLTQVGLSKVGKEGQLGYTYEMLKRPTSYNGSKHGLSSDVKVMGFRLAGTASTMHSRDTSYETSFARYALSLSRSVGSNTLGVSTEQEYNKWTDGTGELSVLSSRYMSGKVSVARTDSSIWTYSLSAEMRDDYSADTLADVFARDYRSYDFTSQVGLVKNQNNRFNIYGYYRILKPVGSNSSEEPEKNITGRIEHQLGLMKRLVTANTFYELSSGLETKKTYYYVEVTEGQGVYMWNEQTDYNDNGIAELNEFEVAKYKSQANYVKVFVSTSEYLSVFSNQFSEVVGIDPRKVIKATKGFPKLVSRFSSSSTFKSSFKTTSDDYLENANPFVSTSTDTSLVSLSKLVKNTLYFNRTGGKFSTSLSSANEQNKSLTTNGWELREDRSTTSVTRLDLLSFLTGYVTAGVGVKQADCQASFLENKNYDIDYYSIEPKLTFQPNAFLAFDALFNYSRQENTGGEVASQKTIGQETRASGQKLGKLSLNVKLINIDYNADATTSLAYVMLDGLQPGNNYTWEASYQRELGKNLRLSLQYQGQKSKGVEILHTGTMQLSAYF